MSNKALHPTPTRVTRGVWVSLDVSPMRYLTALLLLFAHSAFAESFNEREFTYKGIEYVTKIPNDLKDTWTPGSPTPLSVEKALTLANAEFSKLFAKLGSFSLNMIALNLVSEPNGWLYMIVYTQDGSELEYSTDNSGVRHAQVLTVAYYVTMEGHVYAPSKK